MKIFQKLTLVVLVFSCISMNAMHPSASVMARKRFQRVLFPNKALVDQMKDFNKAYEQRTKEHRDRIRLYYFAFGCGLVPALTLALNASHYLDVAAKKL